MKKNFFKSKERIKQTITIPKIRVELYRYVKPNFYRKGEANRKNGIFKKRVFL